ncbi:MAG TPA: hypothetical protein VFO55_07805 [Gemmatimonadaceae bacterium]|nr:hypothetical protein [Gemmatimonadaceae bacterium]
MRYPILLPALFLVAAASTLEAQSTGDWEFVGVEISEKVGCINNPVTKYESHWIARGPGFDAQLADLRAALKAKHSYYASTTRYTVRPGKPVAIGVVRKTVSCGQWSSNERKTVYSYKFYFGPDRAAVEEKARNESKQYKEILATEVIDWIDVAGELARRRGQ